MEGAEQAANFDAYNAAYVKHEGHTSRVWKAPLNHILPVESAPPEC